MLLKFIGVGNAANYQLGHTSAYIEYGDNKNSLLLIDCGDTTFLRMLSLGLLEGKENLDILITHPHPDHISSLGSLIFHANIFNKISPCIYYPHPDVIMNILKLQGVNDTTAFFSVSPPKEFHTEEIQNMKFLEMNHMQGVKSYAYTFKFKERVTGKSTSVFYSGDGKLQVGMQEALKYGHYDEWYQDTFSKNLQVPHTTLDELIEEVPEYLRHKVYCIHRDIGFDDSEAIRRGFNVPQPASDRTAHLIITIPNPNHNTDLSRDVKEYRDTKSISHKLVAATKKNLTNLQGKTIYRGDCMYPSFLKVGARFRFYNHVSSWSFSLKVATSFINPNCAPDWYFDEREWYSDEPYPFRAALDNNEELEPILLILENSPTVRGLITADYVDVENDDEYVGRDEEEIILGDTEFVITDIKPVGQIKYVYLKHYKSDVKSFK